MAFKLLGGVKSYGLGFDSTAYITGNIFELYPVTVVAATAPGGGMEGVIPLAPGQIQNLYQPVDSPYLVPWRREYRPIKISHVGIKIKLLDDGEFAGETYFVVQEPETGFTVELTPVKGDSPIIVFKPTPPKIAITTTKPSAFIRKKVIKINRRESEDDK